MDQLVLAVFQLAVGVDLAHLEVGVVVEPLAVAAGLGYAPFDFVFVERTHFQGHVVDDVVDRPLPFQVVELVRHRESAGWLRAPLYKF